MKKRILLFIAIKIVIVCVAIPQKHYTPDLKCCDITIQVLDLKVETAKKNIQTVLRMPPTYIHWIPLAPALKKGQERPLHMYFRFYIKPFENYLEEQAFSKDSACTEGLLRWVCNFWRDILN